MDLNNAFIYHHFEVEHDFAALVSLLHDVELYICRCSSQPYTGLSPNRPLQSKWRHGATLLIPCRCIERLVLRYHKKPFLTSIVCNKSIIM